MLLLRTTIFFLAFALSCINVHGSLNDEFDEDLLNPAAADGVFEDTFLDDEIYPTNDTVDENLSKVLEDLSAVPCCVTNYAKLSRQDAKLVLRISTHPSPTALCTKSNGDFVASYWRASLRFVYLFNKHGWVKKKVMLPTGTAYSAGCAFSSTNLFYVDYNRRRILQFSDEGKYQKIFTTGAQFLQLKARDDMLYATILNSKEVRVYDVNNGKLMKSFQTTTANARGLAFDPAGYLHVSTLGKTVEVFNQDDTKALEITYPELSAADGLLVDSFYFTVIADRGRRQVLVYNHARKLVKRMTGFSLPVDVAIGYNCNSLLVSDQNGNAIYFL